MVQSRCCWSCPWSKVLEIHGGFLEVRGCCCWPSSPGLPFTAVRTTRGVFFPSTLLSLQWSCGGGWPFSCHPHGSNVPLFVCGGGAGLGEERRETRRGDGDGPGSAVGAPKCESRHGERLQCRFTACKWGRGGLPASLAGLEGVYIRALLITCIGLTLSKANAMRRGCGTSPRAQSASRCVVMEL